LSLCGETSDGCAGQVDERLSQAAPLKEERRERAVVPPLIARWPGRSFKSCGSLGITLPTLVLPRWTAGSARITGQRKTFPSVRQPTTSRSLTGILVASHGFKGQSLRASDGHATSLRVKGRHTHTPRLWGCDREIQRAAARGRSSA